MVRKRRIRDEAIAVDPLHLAVDAREVHRAHHAAVAKGRAVAVLEVGLGHAVVVVANEWDRVVVRSEWGTGQTQARCRVREGDPYGISPRVVVACVVDLIEHHDASQGELRQGGGTGRDLLVGGDHTMHIGRKHLVGGTPAGIQMQVELRGRIGPLRLQVLGWRHHDQSSAGERSEPLPCRGEGKRRLARAWRGDGQEVGRRAGGEGVEGSLLPAP